MQEVLSVKKNPKRRIYIYIYIYIGYVILARIFLTSLFVHDAEMYFIAFVTKQSPHKLMVHEMKGTYRYIPILQPKRFHCYFVVVFCIFDGMKKKKTLCSAAMMLLPSCGWPVMKDTALL